MNASHPNILPLIAVEIKHDARKLSMISEMMTNGNMVVYIRKNRANRVRLVRPLVVDSAGRTADWSRSWRMSRMALNISTNPISSMEI